VAELPEIKNLQKKYLGTRIMCEFKEAVRKHRDGATLDLFKGEKHFLSKARQLMMLLKY
jgi:hypothetical protein